MNPERWLGLLLVGLVFLVVHSLLELLLGPNSTENLLRATKSRYTPFYVTLAALLAMGLGAWLFVG